MKEKRKNKRQNKKQNLTNYKGITLISLVVTIVVLLILAGITINVAFGNGGIMKSARELSNKVQETQEQKNQELNDLLQKLEETMNNEGEVELTTNITWSNEIATLKLTATIPDYTIYYKLSNGEYIQYTTPIINLMHGSNVEVKLSKENKPDKTLTVNIIDSGMPSAEIRLGTNSTKVGETITATVTHTDNESGVSITSCKYIYNQVSTNIGTTSSAWNSATPFSSNPETINLKATEEGTYYLHVLTVDKAENKKETVSQPVVVEGKTIESLITTASDKNETILDKYGNKIVIPAGFKIVPHGTKENDNNMVEYTYDKVDGASTNTPVVQDGIVIKDASKTYGNEFVWVPVGEIKNDAEPNTENITTITLGRYSNFKIADNGSLPTPAQTANKETYDTPIPISNADNGYFKHFEISSDFAGGTFEGKTYKAASSYANTKAYNLQEWISTTLDNGGYYIARYEASKNGDKPASKVSTGTLAGNGGLVYDWMLWNNITQPNAAIASRAMYPNSEGAKYYSDLINSYAWDTAIIFIEKYSGDTTYASKNGTDIYAKLANTGTIPDKKCNIHDMAGNTQEWTTETNTISDQTCTYRGGHCLWSGTYYTAVRKSGNTSNSNENKTFRTLLCVK